MLRRPLMYKSATQVKPDPYSKARLIKKILFITRRINFCLTFAVLSQGGSDGDCFLVVEITIFGLVKHYL